MKLIFSLAIRNILRYKRRTLLTFLVLSVGIGLYIIMGGMYDGVEKMTVANLVDFQSGHFQVVNSDFDEDAPFSSSNFIADPRKVTDFLDSRGYVTAWAERVQFQAEADNGVDATPVLVTGIDPQRDNRVFNLTNFIVRGGYSSPAPDSALLGTGLAKDLGLDVGSPFYITFRNGQGMIDSIELMVAGILNAPDPLVNSSGVYVTMEGASRFLNAREVSLVALKISDMRRTASCQADLVKGLKGFRVRSWREMAQGVLAISETKKKFTSAIVFFLVVIALVGIVNTMLMSVFEKTREIGTLKALGMRDREILGLFLTEGAFIGALGGAGGLVFGCLVNAWLSIHGMDLQSMASGVDMSSFRIASVIYSSWNVPAIAGSFVVCVAASLLASWYPARKAVAMQAAECLRTG